MTIFGRKIHYDKKNPKWIDLPTYIRDELIRRISKGAKP